MPEPVTAAPAPQPVAEPQLTAADQAVVSNDVSAYRTARQAERSGTPLAPAPVEPPAESEGDTPDPAAPAHEGERKLSKRQQQINDYERRIAEQAAELARLKASPPPAPAPATPRREPSPPSTSTIPYLPELKTYENYLAAHPEAQYEDYTDARADFRANARDQQAKAHEKQTRIARERQTRATAFHERLTVAERDDPAFADLLRQARLRQADPTFDALRSLNVFDLRPIDVLRPDEPVTALNALAQELLVADNPIPILRHFADHQEDVTRFAMLTTHRDLLRELAKVEATLDRPQTPAAPPSKPVTSAPPPPTTLGSKPAEPADELEAAVASDDMGRYRAVRLRQRTAALLR